MKPISSAGLERRYASAQRVAWLLELADGDWLWRGATLAASLDAAVFPARIGSAVRWREWLPEQGREGGRARAEAELFVPELPGGAGADDPLRSALETRAPVGIAATLKLAWLDVKGVAAPAAATMLRGRLTDWQIMPGGISLTLTDELEAIGERRIGRLLRPSMIPGAVSPAMGTPMPWIFGALEDAELVPLDIGAATRLAADINDAVEIIPIVSAAGFPASGIVQIGAEFIKYNIIDSAASTLGRGDRPVARSLSPAAHRKGDIVRRVPPSGFLWLVSDHLCHALGPVRADGLPLASDAWTPLALQLAGKFVQAVRMPSWPLDADGRPAISFSARVQGLEAFDGSLVENPARAIEALLTGDRLGQLAADRLDADNFAAAADALAASGYRFAARLTGSETIGELLDGAAEEAGLWIQSTDPIRLVRADPTPHAASVAEDHDEHRLLEPARPASLRAPAGFIPPDAVELVGVPPGPGLGRATRLFPPEREFSGVIPRKYSMRWLDLASEAASDLGELLWRRLGEAPFIRMLDLPLGSALASCGETVRISDEPLEMAETLGWVRSIAIGEARAEAGAGARAKLEVWGPWAGAYCWKQDLLNYIRRFAFGGHAVFVLNGQPAGLLTRGGTLRIRGTLRENATLPAGPLDGPIAISGGQFLFCTGAAGSFTPFMSLDGAGDLHLAGSLQERSTLAIDAEGLCHGATVNLFWISSDTRSGGMEWRQDTGVLHLPEILIENVRL